MEKNGIEQDKSTHNKTVNKIASHKKIVGREGNWSNQSFQMQLRTWATCKYPVPELELEADEMYVGLADGFDITLIADKSTNVGMLTEVMPLNTICRSSRMSWFVRAVTTAIKEWVLVLTPIT